MSLLPRSSPLRSKTRLRKQSAKARAKKRLPKVTGHCQVRWLDCMGRAVAWHHKLARSQGGSDERSNLLAVCAACHSDLHEHPRLAAQAGFIVSKKHDPTCPICGAEGCDL